MSRPNTKKRHDVRSYVVGYGGAIILTGIAFALVHWQQFPNGTTFAVILGLALIQAIVHFRFFLHISLGRSARDDLWLILFSGMVIALMVGGTLVILANLRHRMM